MTQASGQGETITREVVVTDSGDLLAPGIERLRSAGIDVTVLPDGSSAATVARAVTHASVVIDGVTHLGDSEIRAMQAAVLIIRAGIGYDTIDVAAATRRGIWVANVPDYCVEEVADHATLLLLAASRRLDAMLGLWRGGQGWYRYDALPPVHRLTERVLGIVGMGRIGTKVAKRAAAFGWRIVGYDAVLSADTIRERGAEPLGLEELLATADAITLHCPLTTETYRLIDERRIALTKPGVVIVNTSRGGLVDVDALDAAVVSGHVSAAGLDVLEDEPDPDLDHPVLHRDNVFVTSHVAWYSVEAKRELALLCADEAIRVLDGRTPRNAVNLAARELAAREKE